ncbi:MAG: NAD-dependent epimerase/dehydratase family protein [Candidatus Liptonbacteria bacterium]|nr:NAD-dependent epimerase/dehydratase family protein [Candidatus Liptonbacteria bacterium]
MVNVKGKRFLVTGGAGFIGSHTVDALLARGAKVAIVDNLSTGRKENVNPKAKFYRMNIASPSLKNVFDKFRPEYVYHFAFHVLVPRSTEDPLLDRDGIVGSVNLFKNCERNGVKKVVFSSSGFLYGNTARLPARETEPLSFISPYIASKHAVENYLKVFNHLHGLPHVIFRYAAIYGPRQATGAMADYVRQLSKGKQAKIWGDGKKTRDYVYIDDVIRANLLALGVPKNHPNPIFNVGTGVETSLNTLYRGIAKLLGKEARPIYVPDRPGEQLRYALDASKIRRELRWRPTVSLEEGLRRVIKSRNFA